MKYIVKMKLWYLILLNKDFLRKVQLHIGIITDKSQIVTVYVKVKKLMLKYIKH